MGFTIDHVVPWGRNLEEYQRMFAFTPSDLDKQILSCADGPASVNAELFREGKNYTSLDPIYEFTSDQIRERIEATAPIIAEQLSKNKADYLWNYYQSPDHLVQTRRVAMDKFLEDFELHHDTDRYITGTLPDLPFTNRRFDLVVCSHYLFMYSEQLNEEVHRRAALEMCRVGKEVRIFPLLEVNGTPSRHLKSFIRSLKEQGIKFEIVAVDYEFQKGGNQMLKLIS